jgi:hypothetical protein
MAARVMKADKTLRISTIKEKLTVTPIPKTYTEKATQDTNDTIHEVNTSDLLALLQKMEVSNKTVRSTLEHTIIAVNNSAKYVEKIPTVKADIRELTFGYSTLEKNIESINTNLNALHNRFDSHITEPRKCLNLDRIETLEEKSGDFAMGDARFDERLNHVMASVKSIDRLSAETVKNRKQFYLGLVGVIITLIISALSAAMAITWRASKLDSQVETNRLLSEQQMESIKRDIHSIGKGNKAIVQHLESVPGTSDNVQDPSTGHTGKRITARAWYESLSESEKRVLKRALRSKSIDKLSLW